MKGYERSLSRKAAETICKSALDALSLLFGSAEYFHQQALCDERLLPLGSNSLLETDGYLWLPGTKLGPGVRHLSFPDVRDHLNHNQDFLIAVGNILDAVLSPATSKHPSLSKRWETALNWMAEGTREKNDAVALAKIASCLDVLSCVGKFRGILAMLAHLTKKNSSDVVVKGIRPRTLQHVVKDIYDNGRSQILHGTHIDRLQSFEAWRNHATFFARLALIECAIRLKKYQGPDDREAFRTIPE